MSRHRTESLNPPEPNPPHGNRKDFPGARRSVSLDGEWLFQFGDEQPQAIQVPCPWESAFPALHNRAGTAVYERTFHIPEGYEGNRILMSFGAVDYFTEVWVNGTLVGTHEGGYTPFSFSIEHALPSCGPEAIQTVLVRVTDSTADADAVLTNGSPLSFAEIPHGKQSWYTSVSGIWQSVTLEARAHTSIERAVFLPNIDAGTVEARLVLRSPNGFGPGWQARIVVDAPRGAGAVVPTVLPLTEAQRGAEGIVELTATLPILDALLWDTETPNLYSALVTLEHEGEVIDALQRRFGMRHIETREGRVWLNHKPVFIMGALDQAFYPRSIYTPPSTDFLRDQFVKAKEMGLNLMRCHIKVPTESYLDLCDELGLLVWYELPNGARLTQPFRDRARQTIEAMMERDACHPCIVILTLMNESWGIDLNDAEQRRWLASTYRWAKQCAPGWLVVDNSACIPNFHIVSDLEDYHIYFNIPDQAEDFAEWVRAFASHEAGTYTGYGDAEQRLNEPLLISEFGNWGLPHYDKILEAEGGEPYWFKTGDGATRPAKALERFKQQNLGRVFKDYNALADASQEQEWLSLKWEIEEMRLHSQVAGYVITEFTDVNWECNGLLDMARNRKVFHHRLKDVQAQDILIPRLSPRTAFWEGETAALTITFSSFSGRTVLDGTIEWCAEGFEDLRGEEPVRLGGGIDSEPKYGSYQIAHLWITAPQVAKPTKSHIQIVLRARTGEIIAQNTQSIVFAPMSMRSFGRNQTVWVHDPLGSSIGLSSLLTGVGFKVVGRPEPGAIGVVTRWDPTVSSFLRNEAGARVVLVASHSRSITIASGLGVRLLERNTNGWWGDWCTSKAWFVPELFPSLPDTIQFDFEYQPIVPERVLTGPLPANIVAGLFVGWVHNPAALVAQIAIGNGELIVTTFDLLPHLGSDPIATLMLHDLIVLPPASRGQ